LPMQGKSKSFEYSAIVEFHEHPFRCSTET
jgi:hypothetical protein